MKNIILIASLVFCMKAHASTHVIGKGSGTISKTSMAGLSPGDILAITPGTYSAATFSNLNNITIINNGGIVTFSGRITLDSGLLNITFSGTGAPGIMYGFQFGTPSTIVTDFPFLLTSSHIQGLRIYYCEFWNIHNNIVDAAHYYPITYNGDTSALKVYKCTFDHWHTHSSGLIFQGSFGTANQFLEPVDSITATNMIIDTIYGNGIMFGGAGIYRANIHDWKVNGYAPYATGDIGLIMLHGNGNIYNIYRHFGYGYIARIWGCGLNEKGVTNIYNCIDLTSIAYGTIDVRVDTSMLSVSKTPPTIWGSDFHIFNNTCGNKSDMNGYVCPFAIVGQFLSATYKMEIRNNLAFNNHYGANTMINNNGEGNVLSDTSNNFYLSGSQILQVLSDTINCYIKAGSFIIDKGYTEPVGSKDFGGISRPQGKAWDIGARELYYVAPAAVKTSYLKWVIISSIVILSVCAWLVIRKPKRTQGLLRS